MAFDTKKGHGLLWNKLAQNRLIWNILVGLTKIPLMGYISHSIFVKKYKFHIRIRKYQLIKIFEIHLAIKHLRGQWISKIFISPYFWILTQNLYFLTKTEWEKCPISDILDKLTKLFQIRQVWTSLCDNEPYPNFASKVVSYDGYHQYKVCF